MRRTHQRQLGTRRSACIDGKARRGREFIAELVRAHVESIALAQALRVSHERSLRRQADADRGLAFAAANPDDLEAHDRAIELAALAEAARLAEMSAADTWASHVMRVHGLMAMTDELACDSVSAAPGGEGPTASAAPAAAPIRSRCDCFGRPG